MKNLTVYAVEHDHGGWTIRTTPVPPRWTEGPDKDCTVHEAVLTPKAARAIGAILAEAEAEGTGCEGLMPEGEVQP